MPAEPPATIPSRRRLLLGGGIFVLGQLCPLLVPLVATSDLPTGWKGALSGLLLAGLPELAILAAVAVLGKQGFEYLKRLLLQHFSRFAPADRVSRTRYRAGLVLFALPLAFALLTPYAGHRIPGYQTRPYLFGLVGDGMLITSLFVLGGDFWDKLRALFVYEARATFAE